MASPSVRLYLTGRCTIEVNGETLDGSGFPGLQGRVAFAYLVLERGRPASRSELAEALWPRDLPPKWEAALSAIVSKLRAMVATAGVPWAELTGARGWYELRLAPGAWVDIEAAAEAIHDAETALRAGDARRAYGPSAVAHHIARRPFLPGESGAWVESWQQRLRAILLRALEARGEVYLCNAEPALALQAATDLIALEPFRESGHRLVMRAHEAMGNSAQALQAYEECRRLIARELGVDPSPQTKAEYERLLQSL